MHLIPILLLLSLPLNGQTSLQGKNFSINGTTSAPYEGYIYLQYGLNKDSVLVEDQKFSFAGTVDHPVEARFRTIDGATQEYFYLENSEMEIEIEIAPPFIHVISLSGNKTALLMYGTLEAIQSLEQESFQEGLYTILDTLIQNNARNQYSGMILSEISMDPILTFEQVQSLYSKLDTTIVHPDDKAVLTESLRKLRHIRIGGELLPFQFPDKNGELMGVNDFDAKLLLVEFWASDCRPCRITNPQLVKLHDRYKPSGFDILGVSLDTRRDAWQKAIDKDGLTWKQTIVEEAFDNPTLRKLGIQYLPSSYLLDKEGTIKAINIQPSELQILLMNEL